MSTRRLHKTHRRSSSSPTNQPLPEISSDQPDSPAKPSPHRKRLVKPHAGSMIQKSDTENIEMERTKEFARKILHNDTARPQGPLRLPSFSRRHASFDTPREIPLPPSSYSDRTPSMGSSVASSSSYFDDAFEARSVSTAPTTPSSERPGDERNTSESKTADDSSSVEGASSVFPFPRPYSLPDHAPLGNSYGIQASQTKQASEACWPDRNSSASLPLPMQTPYSTLPTVDGVAEEGRERGHRPTPERLGSSSTIYPESGPKGRSNEHPTTNPSGPKLTTTDKPLDTPALTTFVRSNSTASSHAPPIRTQRPMSASSVRSYPPPAPPTILDPVTLPEPRAERQNSTYESFLSHVAPPEDSWIAVETKLSEYKLVIRLPGFRRDGITLATRRRRILHVVADSWEAGGGHFERRIAFGYDADLVQVRAEFNGDLLTVTIPRRQPPIGGWTGNLPAPIGRS